MSDHVWKAYAHGMNVVLSEGGIYVHSLLLKSYRALGMSHAEAMLMLQIMQASTVEQHPFPTPEQLATTMGAEVEEVTGWLQRLINEGFLSIDHEMVNDLIVERYNWSGWVLKASTWHAQQLRANKQADRRKLQVIQQQDDVAKLFHMFEQEFGRPLSPMEYETINAWFDQDQYSEELITLALKEAVFAGKLSFRYIDRILIDWSRHRVTNAEELKAYRNQYYNKNL